MLFIYFCVETLGVLVSFWIPKQHSRTQGFLRHAWVVVHNRRFYRARGRQSAIARDSVVAKRQGRVHLILNLSLFD